MAVSEDAVAVLAAKFAVMRKVADERDVAGVPGVGGAGAGPRRDQGGGACGGCVGDHGGRWGVRDRGPVSWTGCRRDGPRQPGAGRRKAEDTQPGLRQALKELAGSGHARRSGGGGHLVLAVAAGPGAADGPAGVPVQGRTRWRGCWGEDGYSLQGMARVLEGRQHPDRDDQFRRINAVIAEFTAAGDPAVSVDGKKKEQLGPYRAGRSWRPGGTRCGCATTTFPARSGGRSPLRGLRHRREPRLRLGRHQLRHARVRGASVRRWWCPEGSSRYPGAGRLLVVCDAGGSNGCAGRVWKVRLAELAAETGLEITVCHFPPGTWKWNKIEHRLFCHITRTWRARPLMTAADAAAGIAATTTYQGLKCTAVLDEGGYPGERKSPSRG